MNNLNHTQKASKKQSKVFSVIQKVYRLLSKIFLYVLVLILLVVLVLFTLYFIDAHKNMKSGVKKHPLFGAYIIISPSMVPTIKVEDAIVIQRKDEDELKVGDIITFLSSDPRYSGLTITHRIVAIEKSKKGELYYRTKGDNNNTEDSALVSYRNVYGKVIVTIPKIGYLQRILTNVYGWIFFIIIPCIALVVYDVVKLLKSMRKNSNQRKKSQDLPQQEYVELIEVKEKKKKDEDIEII